MEEEMKFLGGFFDGKGNILLTYDEDWQLPLLTKAGAETIPYDDMLSKLIQGAETAGISVPLKTKLSFYPVESEMYSMVMIASLGSSTRNSTEEMDYFSPRELEKLFEQKPNKQYQTALEVLEARSPNEEYRRTAGKLLQKYFE